MRVFFMLLLSCGLILALVGCGGGGGSTPPPPPTVTVSPSSATVALGGTQQFSATSNALPVTATWSVNGQQGGNSTVGTIDATGKYTAPASFPSPDTFMVTAVANGGTGNANLTVAFPNNNHLTQALPIKVGTTGGNSTDSTTSGKTITCCSGTLGSLVIKGGNFFILSNNHVLDKSDQGANGDPIGQPGLVDNNCSAGTTVANLSQAAALKPSPCTTTPCTGPAPSNVDAALAQIVSPATVDTSGSILDLGAAGSTSIAAAPPSGTIALPAVGQSVAKSGRSTGLTCSSVTSVTTMVSVDYDSSCGGAKAFTSTFNNQVVINGGSFSASGDSGSLVVTSDTARPVALLFAGNNTSTTANPIQAGGSDVQTALGPFIFPVNPDHPVSCDPTVTASSASKTVGPNSAQLSRHEAERAATVKATYAARLFSNPAIRDISIGPSADNPQEGALLITVSGAAVIPATLDGVRTRVIYSGVHTPLAAVDAFSGPKLLSKSRAEDLMSQPGVQGVGVGISDDDSAEPAMVIYVITGMPHPEIPAVIDGLRTKIIEGDRFRAFGWGKETRPSSCAQKQQSKVQRQ